VMAVVTVAQFSYVGDAPFVTRKTFTLVTGELLMLNTGFLWGGLGKNYITALSAKAPYWALETSFSGFIPNDVGPLCSTDGLRLNDQSTCTAAPGIPPNYNLWGWLSRNYATQLSGILNIFQDGNRGPIIPAGNVFSDWEKPVFNIKSSPVTKVNVFLVTNGASPTYENCATVTTAITQIPMGRAPGPGVTVLATPLAVGTASSVAGVITQLNGNGIATSCANEAQVAVPVSPALVDPTTLANLATLLQKATGLTANTGTAQG